MGLARANQLLRQCGYLHGADIARRADDHMRVARHAIEIAGGAPVSDKSDMVVGIDNEEPKQFADGYEWKSGLQHREFSEIQNILPVILFADCARGVIVRPIARSGA